MEHPFFKTKPLPCSPKEIKKLDIEYHDYLIREKEIKAKQEKQNEMMKRELQGTRQDRRDNEDSRDEKKERDRPINLKPKNQPDRLALLFGGGKKTQGEKLKRTERKDSDDNFENMGHPHKKNSFEMTYKNDSFKKRMPEFSNVSNNKDYDPYNSNTDKKNKFKR